MVLVIDNYDSFTYNLVQYLGEMTSVEVVRNDKIELTEIEDMAPDQIVISPGPGRPEDAGISSRVFEHFSGSIPLLGVCLGHQCLGEVLGGRVIKSDEIFHGKTSDIFLTACRSERSSPDLFSGISSPFRATRYHSLILEKKSLPAELDILAETRRGEVMAAGHKKFPAFGLQFHPESILTDQGRKMLENFLSMTA